MYSQAKYNISNGIQQGKGGRHSLGAPLSRVGNKPYGKQDSSDAPSIKPTPKLSAQDDDDINREPEASSEDEAASPDSAADTQLRQPTRSRHIPTAHPPRINSPRVAVPKEEDSNRIDVKGATNPKTAKPMVTTRSGHDTQSKAPTDEEDNRMSVWTSDRKRKRSTPYNNNIHAPSQSKTYVGKGNAESKSRGGGAKGTSGFKAPPGGAANIEKPTFKRPPAEAKGAASDSDLSSPSDSLEDQVTVSKVDTSKKNNKKSKKHGFVQPRGQSTAAEENGASSDFRVPPGLPTPASSLSSRQENGDRPTRRSARTAARNTANETADLPEFEIPASITDDNINSLLNDANNALEKPFTCLRPSLDQPSSPLSSVPDSSIFSSAQSPPGLAGLSDDEDPVCPMCRDPVDPDLFLSWTVGKPRMTLREQTQFCVAHKQHQARQTCRKRGYPDIDWSSIHGRMHEQSSFISRIIHLRTPSYFRAKLAERVDKGANRGLRKTLASGAFEALTPGYYGPKGARLMMDHIIKHFSASIQTRAGSDRLIAAEGVSGYVQAVLVPELATRLVMEDMGVDEERAREVMEESIEVGELLNEQKQDFVRVEEDGEDGGLYE